MKAAEFDEKFDAGDDITGRLDGSRARRPGLEPKHVNVDFPTWRVNALDHEARQLGVTRQALITFWLADRRERRDPRP